MTRDLEGIEKGPKDEIHINLLKTTVKEYQNGKRLDVMVYMVSCSRNSPPFTRD